MKLHAALWHAAPRRYLWRLQWPRVEVIISPVNLQWSIVQRQMSHDVTMCSGSRHAKEGCVVKLPAAVRPAGPGCQTWLMW